VRGMYEQARHFARDRLRKELLPGEPTWHALAADRVRARAYVGTDDRSGLAQFEILMREGLCPTSRVLEIGCGALHAAVPILHYLEPGLYAGIDPNVWLRRAQLHRWEVRRLAREKRPQFLSNEDFDARELEIQFDYVLSHSILSHAAHWQLEPFFRNAGAVLAPGGRILASIRLAEGNAFGSPGSSCKGDSRHPSWVYPGVSWFTLKTVQAAAGAAGLTVQCKPEYTALLTAQRPNEVHDWLLATRHGGDGDAGSPS
jgi:SAM-dependent methyltransferase